jgi:DNA-binding response OmpR family regulator
MKNVLIVDDDLDLLRMYSQKLTFEGYDVATAETGQQALKYLESTIPNIILLDVMLPAGMNGFDVLENIRQNNNTKGIPVIMLTNLDSEKNTALKVGAQDYLVKANTDLNVLVEKVAKLAK